MLSLSVSDYKVSASDTSGSQFMQAHQEILDSVNAELDAELQEAIHDGAKQTRTYLRGNSPKDTGDYAKDWAVNNTDRDGHHEGTVYNRKHYQLTHLLMDGHESKNQYGGPYGHVDPAEPQGYMDRAQQAGLDAISKRLGIKVGGGQ